ncbi:MAG: sulfatase-like hydrolase/transferase [Pirellulaceae bacterium]
MIRQVFIHALIVILICSGHCVGQERPNVLLITIDDLNDWIGCLGGHPQALTPNIDRLAERGMLFTNAHCAAPACNPSRGALFSGLMPNTTGVWSNGSKEIAKVHPADERMPAVFRKAGYRALGTGKLYHRGGKDEFDEYYAVEQRWSPFSRKRVQYSDGESASKGSGNPRHELKDSQGRNVVLPLNRMPSDRNPTTKEGESFDWGGFDLADDEFGDTKITDWAIAKLNDRHDTPLFLGVGYYRPHIPLWAPNRFFERFKTEPAQLPSYSASDLDDLSEIGKLRAREAVTAGSHSTVVEYDEWENAVAAYLACTTYIDEEVGRLLDALDESGLADNTIVILCSDHGWHLGEKEHWGKWTGWERSTNVPLIVVPPKTDAKKYSKPGVICQTPVGLIDLYPTLMEICNLDGPEILDGDSLVSTLKNPKAPFRPTTLTMFGKGNAALSSATLRYIRYAEGDEELYDLGADPNEWRNLAKKGSVDKSLSRMRAELNAHLAKYEVDANRVSASQLKWVGTYRKQENVPVPTEMLVNSDDEPDLDQGFTRLFNGSLDGWVARGGECTFEARGNVIVGECVPGSPSTYLCTEREDFEDFIFTAELKHEVDGNTGVMFRAKRKPGNGKSEQRETVFGPQCEMESYAKQRYWSGGIYGQSAGGWIYPMWLAQHNDVRHAVKPFGEWNRLTVEARGSTIKTWLNGVPAAHWETDESQEGYFGLQIHAGRKGKVHFQNVKVKEL